MSYANDKTEEVDLKTGGQAEENNHGYMPKLNNGGDGSSFADSEEMAPTGIAKVEAAHAMAGKTSKILLWCG